MLREVLRRHGCDQFQGFLASKPLVAERFKDLLDAVPMTSLLHAAQTGEPTLAQP